MTACQESTLGIPNLHGKKLRITKLQDPRKVKQLELAVQDLSHFTTSRNTLLVCVFMSQKTMVFVNF